MPLLTYRHFHEESNVAAVVSVALAECGLASFDTELRRQELELHGILQAGAFREGRGLLLSNALRYLRNGGMSCQTLHDGNRTTALSKRLTAERPGFQFQLLADLNSPPAQPLIVDCHLAPGKSVALVEARAGVGRLPLHVLLARVDQDQVQVMNSDTGQNHACSLEQFKRHLASPVHFGATAFAGPLYLYTGLAFSLSPQGGSL